MIIINLNKIVAPADEKEIIKKGKQKVAVETGTVTEIIGVAIVV